MTAPSIVSLGAGRMGRSMAMAYAYAGEPVAIIDLKPRSDAEFTRLQADARAEIRANLQLLASFGLFDLHRVETIAQRISIVAMEKCADVLSHATIAYEGVPEVIQQKRAALQFACKHLPKECIIASTTSSMLVTELAPLVSHPERFLNAHWLNPAFLVPLVELSPHPATSRAVIDTLRRSLEAIGKVPILCQPAPGYIVPRLQTLVMNEAARMIEEGVATAEEIDKAIRYGFGFRYATMGVVEFLDFGGIDILHHAAGYFTRILGERFRAPQIVADKMASGEKGLREGKGFYDWSGANPDTYRTDALRRQADLLRHMGLLRPPKLD